MWKRSEHPNIVPLLGVTVVPLQLVSVWMPSGDLLEYIERNSSVNRLSLVGSSRATLNSAPTPLARFLTLLSVSATYIPVALSMETSRGFVCGSQTSPERTDRSRSRAFLWMAWVVPA